MHNSFENPIELTDAELDAVSGGGNSSGNNSSGGNHGRGKKKLVVIKAAIARGGDGGDVSVGGDLTIDVRGANKGGVTVDLGGDGGDATASVG